MVSDIKLIETLNEYYPSTELISPTHAALSYLPESLQCFFNILVWNKSQDVPSGL